MDPTVATAIVLVKATDNRGCSFGSLVAVYALTKEARREMALLGFHGEAHRLSLALFGGLVGAAAELAVPSPAPRLDSKTFPLVTAAQRINSRHCSTNTILTTSPSRKSFHSKALMSPPSAFFGPIVPPISTGSWLDLAFGTWLCVRRWTTISSCR